MKAFAQNVNGTKYSQSISVRVFPLPFVISTPFGRSTKVKLIAYDSNIFNNTIVPSE